MRPLVVLLVAALAAPASAQPVIYVDANATGANTGASWADAFTDLQDALGAAEAGEEVWVAEGLYTPTTGSNRTVSFVLVSGVGLYGGFEGTEANRDERDWTENETVLSGDVGVPGDSTDNSYHVVVASGVDNTAALDGFTVERGMARGGDPPHDRGAGILAIGGSPTIRNGYIARNVIGRPVGGEKPGGGLYVEGGSPLIQDCVFEDNGANAGGGAFFSASNPTLRRVRITNSSASSLAFWDGSGGLIEDAVIEESSLVGALIESSCPHFVRTTFRNNQTPSGDGGGAIIREAGAAPVFEDCLFEGNSAARGAGVEIKGGASALFLSTTFRANVGVSTGAAVNAVNATPVFLACRFERNRGSGTGGLSAVGSGVTVIGSVFAGNTSPGTSVGGALFFTGETWDGTPTLVANSLFAGNSEGEGAAIAAFGVGLGEALVVNSTFAGNEAREAGGAVYTSNASGLEIQNSILWGNEAPEGPEVYVAQGGPPMIAQSIVEGGYPSGTNILDTDPLFVRSPDPGADGRWGTEDDDYGDLRLLEGSPAVDYGLAQYLPADTWDLDGDGDTDEPLPIDLAGGPRLLGEAPDLGAYEGGVQVSNEPGGVPAEADGIALRVWPNPVRSVLHIGAPGSDEAIVYDVLGRDVLRLRLDGVTEADVSGLAPGVYVVRAGGWAAVVTVRR